MYRVVTFCDRTFQSVPLPCLDAISQSYNPGICLDISGLGCSPFARRYSGNHFCFLFLGVLRCFSSPGLPTAIHSVVSSSDTGLPHSEICGSKDICSLPQLFAAYHVLLRLREPKASPMRPCLLFPSFQSTIYSQQLSVNNFTCNL